MEEDVFASDDTETKQTQQKPQIKSVLLTPFCTMTDEEVIATNPTLINPTKRG